MKATRTKDHILHDPIYLKVQNCHCSLSQGLGSLSPGYLSVIPFLFQDFGSFSLSLFGILYQIDSLSLPLWFGGHLSCSFTCWVFFCLFILFKLLILGCPFCILAVCGLTLRANSLFKCFANCVVLSKNR